MIEECSFTYSFYGEMLQTLKQCGYSFSDYANWEDAKRPVILRHDIDFDPRKAIRFAEIERNEGAHATYFFLLRSDFYNACSPSVISIMIELLEMGHSIGLRFDEVAYDGECDIIKSIKDEAAILETALGVSGKGKISAVSMHRPSQAVLEGDINIPGIINSYSALFFNEFKYLSDSRHHWRTDPIPVIMSGAYPRLHILTHPFWYHETEQSISRTLAGFIGESASSRVLSICENMRDADEELDRGQLLNARMVELSKRSHDADRVSLRPLRMSDSEDMFEYASVEEVCQFLKWGPYRHLAEAEAWLEAKLENDGASDLLFGIELRDIKKLIGVVRAYNFDAEEGEFEISYILNPAFSGHGYASEAVRKLLSLCFDDLRMKIGNAYADIENIASEALLLRVGFAEDEGSGHDEMIKGRSRSYRHFVAKREGA